MFSKQKEESLQEELKKLVDAMELHYKNFSDYAAAAYHTLCVLSRNDRVHLSEDQGLNLVRRKYLNLAKSIGQLEKQIKELRKELPIDKKKD